MKCSAVARAAKRKAEELEDNPKKKARTHAQRPRAALLPAKDTSPPPGKVNACKIAPKMTPAHKRTQITTPTPESKTTTTRETPQENAGTISRNEQEEGKQKRRKKLGATRRSNRQKLQQVRRVWRQKRSFSASM